MLNLVYFASFRELLGSEGESLALPEGVVDVAGLVAHLAERGGVWQQVMSDSNLLVAVNQEMVDSQESISDGDEVAFFPPVTGG